MTVFVSVAFAFAEARTSLGGEFGTVVAVEEQTTVVSADTAAEVTTEMAAAMASLVWAETLGYMIP